MSKLTKQGKKVILYETEQLEKNETLLIQRYGNTLHIVTIRGHWAIGQTFQEFEKEGKKQ